MALKAGTVGINPKYVDKYGKPKGTGPATESVPATQLTANDKKFFFAYDATSQKYGYKLDGEGDFIPFDVAGGPGWVKPADATTQGITISSNCTVIEGGFAQDADNVYVDLTVKMTVKTNLVISGLPLSEANAASTSQYIPYIKSTTEDIKNVYVGTTSNPASISKDGTSSKITFSSSYLNIDDYIHCVCQYKKATT